MLFEAYLLVAVSSSMVVAQSALPDYAEQSGLPVRQTARFFAFQVTRTTVRIVTTTVNVTKKSLCASLIDVTGDCQRRKRGMDQAILLSFDTDDSIDLYHPSPVQEVETTPFADLDSAGGVDILESSSDAPVEVDIVGLQSECYGRRLAALSAVASGVASALPAVNVDVASGLTSLLNLTLKFKTTLTATVTVTNTVTEGTKSFVVSQCTPSPFLYKTC